MGKFQFGRNAWLRTLTDEQITTIHKHALNILEESGVCFHSEQALRILEEAGAIVDYASKTARLGEKMVIDAINMTPESFFLHNRFNEPVAEIGGNHVHFDPGSATIRFLEADGKTIRPTLGSDLIKIAQVTEAMKNISLCSTALTPSDIPEILGDCFRVYILLKNSTKPFIGGAFSADGVKLIHEFLSIGAGGSEQLKKRPRMVLDVCPTAPLQWSGIACANILDASRLGIPIEFISVPMIGASAPATLAGCVVLHTVETLSGITLAQTVSPGIPIVYGGAPMYFDMRYLTTSLNSIETNLIGTSYAQMAKYYGIPTHTYAALSDAKAVDAQAGLETAMSGVIALLSGINIISGPGVMDFCNTFSLEKLVIDNEICGMAKRYAKGILFTNETLAVDLIKEINHTGDYINTAHTRAWFKKEPYLPSKIIDRKMYGMWSDDGSKNTFELAKEVVADILETKPVKKLDPEIEKALDEIWERALGAAFDSKECCLRQQGARSQ